MYLLTYAIRSLPNYLPNFSISFLKILYLRAQCKNHFKHLPTVYAKRSMRSPVNKELIFYRYPFSSNRLWTEKPFFLVFSLIFELCVSEFALIFFPVSLTFWKDSDYLRIFSLYSEICNSKFFSSLKIPITKHFFGHFHWILSFKIPSFPWFLSFFSSFALDIPMNLNILDTKHSLPHSKMLQFFSFSISCQNFNADWKLEKWKLTICMWQVLRINWTHALRSSCFTQFHVNGKTVFLI